VAVRQSHWGIFHRPIFFHGLGFVLVLVFPLLCNPQN
jgi:hypothetical protein